MSNNPKSNLDDNWMRSSDETHKNGNRQQESQNVTADRLDQSAIPDQETNGEETSLRNKIENNESDVSTLRKHIQENDESSLTRSSDSPVSTKETSENDVRPKKKQRAIKETSLSSSSATTAVRSSLVKVESTGSIVLETATSISEYDSSVDSAVALTLQQEMKRVDSTRSTDSRVETGSVSTANKDGKVEDAPKRAKLRVRALPSSVTAVNDLLSPPEQPGSGKTNPFNVSEVLKGFLYVGAGYDASNRVVTNLPNDNADPALRAERLGWFLQNNVRFALNMAGSPLQKEILGLTYPTEDSIIKLALDVNDVDEWQETMLEQFEKGAQFIEKAYQEHLSVKRSVTAESPGKAPSIFVHCVAGVNRSPFVVVWWLVKHQNVLPETAWDLVRKRRDAGVNWTNITLGGPLVKSGNEEELASIANLEAKKGPKVNWFKELKRLLGK
jgi:hypothetical protein